MQMCTWNKKCHPVNEKWAHPAFKLDYWCVIVRQWKKWKQAVGWFPSCGVRSIANVECNFLRNAMFLHCYCVLSCYMARTVGKDSGCESIYSRSWWKFFFWETCTMLSIVTCSSISLTYLWVWNYIAFLVADQGFNNSVRYSARPL